MLKANAALYALPTIPAPAKAATRPPFWISCKVGPRLPRCPSWPLLPRSRATPVGSLRRVPIAAFCISGSRRLPRVAPLATVRKRFEDESLKKVKEDVGDEGERGACMEGRRHEQSGLQSLVKDGVMRISSGRSGIKYFESPSTFLSRKCSTVPVRYRQVRLIGTYLAIKTTYFARHDLLNRKYFEVLQEHKLLLPSKCIYCGRLRRA